MPKANKTGGSNGIPDNVTDIEISPSVKPEPEPVVDLVVEATKSTITDRPVRRSARRQSS